MALTRHVNVADAIDPQDVPAFHQIAAAVATITDATYITQTPHASLTNEQALSLLATGILKSTTATGVISIATAGVDYENPLTFASGLTRTVNTVTGDYITGKAGGQTWTSGTAASDPLTIRSTSDAIKGTMTLQASQVLLSNAETSITGTLVLDNTSATGQMTIWLKANGTLRGGMRSDYAGNLTWFARGGVHQFFTGGDFGEGTERLHIATDGKVSVYDLAGATAEMVKTSATGLLQRAAAGVDYVFPGTVAPIDAQYLVLTANATLTQERVFTPSSGLTAVDAGAGTTYTLTNDVLTGKTTGQTWYGGVNASATLAIHSTVSGTKGAMTLAASQFLLSNAETGFPAATLILDNTSASGQMAIWAKAAGTLYGGIRIDYGGNHHAFAKGGAYNIWTGGDADTGTTRISVAAAGAVTIADLGGASATLVKTSTVGLLTRATGGTDYVVPGTVAPIDATYLTLTTNATLTNERAFVTSTGLTAVDGGAGGNYTITNDVVTAIAGSATWTGSNNALNLTIKANTASSGNLTLTATGFFLSNAQTTYTTPTLTLDNTNASGQVAVHFKTNGTLRGGLRADFASNMIMFSGASGDLQFFTGGDFATGTERMNIDSGGGVTIADLAGGTTALVRASTAGLLSRTTVATADIDADAVTYAKIQNVTANRLLGREVSGAGDMEEIAIGTGLALSGTTLNTTGLAPDSAQYLTLATSASLTSERVFTPAQGLNAVDGGAGSTYTISNNVFTGEAGSPTWNGSNNANNLTIRANTAASGSISLVCTQVAISGYLSMNIGSPGSTMYLDTGTIGSRDRVRHQPGGGTITDTVDVIYYRIQPAATTYNANISYVLAFFVDSYVATVSAGKTVTYLTGAYIRAPSAAGAGGVTFIYSLWTDGLCRVDGDSSGYVFELPADATAPSGTENTGRIKIAVGGATKYLHYWDD